MSRTLPKRSPLTAEDTFEPPAFTKKTKDPTVVMQPPYHCHCTYKDYAEQKGNFYVVGGELFAANNGYFPVSKTALEGYYNHLVTETGDVGMALHRVAQYLDLYINDDMIDSIKASNDKNPISKLAILARKNPNTNKTYLDVMREQRIAEQLRSGKSDEKEQAKIEVDPRAVELFGIGYEPGEYAILMQHYDMLTKQFENADGVQDSLMRDLCTTKLLQMQQRNDTQAYTQLTKLYADTLKNSGLKTRKADEYADDETATWGQFIAQVEKYSPAEIYEKEDIYKDVDGIGDYITRFFTRSTLNYFGKTDEKDPEFSLTPEEIGDVDE